MAPPSFHTILRLSLAALSACGTPDELTTDARVADDAGPRADAGIADAGASDGGLPRGAFCAPCIQQSDCGPGNLCLGETGHCALDCQTTACPQGSRCEPISRGKAAPHR